MAERIYSFKRENAQIWDADVYTKEQAEAEFPEYSTDFKGAEPGQIVAVLPHTFLSGAERIC